MIIPLSRLRAILGVNVSVTDETLEEVALAAEGMILPLLKTHDHGNHEIDYTEVPNVVEGLTNAAVEVYRFRKAPGGQFSSLDMVPQPFAMGKYFVEKYGSFFIGFVNVKGLIG